LLFELLSRVSTDQFAVIRTRSTPSSFSCSIAKRSCGGGL